MADRNNNDNNNNRPLWKFHELSGPNSDPFWIQDRDNLNNINHPIGLIIDGDEWIPHLLRGNNAVQNQHCFVNALRGQEGGGPNNNNNNNKSIIKRVCIRYYGYPAGGESIIDAGEVRRWCDIVGWALSGLASLTNLEFRIRAAAHTNPRDHDQYYAGFASILNHARISKSVITSFTALIVLNDNDGAGGGSDAGVLNAIDEALLSYNTLEKLRVELSLLRRNHNANNNDAGGLIVSYPFPQSLAALPNLRFVGVDFCDEDIFELRPRVSNFCTPSSISLRELQFWNITVDGPLNMAIAGTISQQMNLESIKYKCCNVTGENALQQSIEIGRSSSLKTLEIDYPSDDEAYRRLANGLRDNTHLSELVVSGAQDELGVLEDFDEYHTHGLRSVLLDGVLGSSTNTTTPLTMLMLTQYFFRTEFDVEGLRAVLTSPFSRLKLLALDCCLFEDKAFRLICDGVGASPSIVDFRISDTRHRYTNASGFAHGLASIANSQTLEVMSMPLGNVSPASSNLAINAILNFGLDTSIKELNFPGLSLLSYAEGKKLLNALKKNYTLTTCPFNIMGSVIEDKKKYIEGCSQTILKLNKNGRRYLVEGNSKSRGVALLSAVSDDLNCIFYHLVENPALCYRNYNSSHNINKASLVDPGVQLLKLRKRLAAEHNKLHTYTKKELDAVSEKLSLMTAIMDS